MYNESEITKLMTLRTERWSLLRGKSTLTESQMRTQLNNVNHQLYELTGKHQYL
jgi:hypothetical protein